MNDCIIIGHGPGIRGAKRGNEIDQFRAIIRFGDGFYWQTPEDYGWQTDYVLSGDQRIADIITNCPQAKEVWVYGRPDYRDEALIMRRLKGYRPYVCRETDGWLQRFKEIGAKGYCSQRCPEDPHFSQGLAAIIMAAERLEEKHICLAGFKNLLAGDNGDYDAETNRGHTIISYHDFEAERRLLDEIIDHYGLEIGDFNDCR